MIEVTYDGQPLHVDMLEVRIDPALSGFDKSVVVEQNLTLNVYYYQLMWLASMIEKQNPKKAKWLRKLAKPHNPLRLVGLI